MAAAAAAGLLSRVLFRWTRSDEFPRVGHASGHAPVDSGAVKNNVVQYEYYYFERERESKEEEEEETRSFVMYLRKRVYNGGRRLKIMRNDAVLCLRKHIFRYDISRRR